MSKIKDGGAAFPIPNDDRPGSYPAEPGMSLRDVMAMAALAGLYASRDLQLATLHDSKNDGFENVMARQAYLQADAMLAAREIEQPERQEKG